MVKMHEELSESPGTLITGRRIAILKSPDQGVVQETLDKAATIDVFRESSILPYSGYPESATMFK
jgi:hypothetical protein